MAMTKNENLFVTAMEECAEIQQAISKILRFGKNNYHPNDPNKETNEHQFLKEYYQLKAVVNMLLINDVLSDLTEDEILDIISNKYQNINNFQQLSMHLGTINDLELPANCTRKDIIENISKSYIPQTERETIFIFKEDNTLTGTADIAELYFNPNATSGGQYVLIYIYKYDVLQAEQNTNTPEEFFEYLESFCFTELIDIDSNEFDDCDKVFCKQQNVTELNELNKMSVMQKIISYTHQRCEKTET